MAQRERPAIIAPPPLLYVAALALVLVLDWVWPLAILDHVLLVWLGWIALILGVALNLWGAWSMKRARTPINPCRPTETIVAAGAFGVSRNPLYVGLSLILLGLVLVLNTLWGIVVLMGLLVLIHYGVVLPEERYLDEKLADEYRRYREKVLRYL